MLAFWVPHVREGKEFIRDENDRDGGPECKSMKLDKFFAVKFNPAGLLQLAGRFLPIRHRYVLTRHNRLRLRYALPSTAACVLALGLALNNIGGMMVQDTGYQSFASTAGTYGPETTLAASQKRLSRYAMPGTGDELGGDMVLASFTAPSEPQPKEKTLKIGKGDTLAGVLQKAGVSAGDALSAVKSMQEYFDPRHIRPGQEVYVRFDPAEGSDFDFAEMRMDIDALKSISLKRAADRSFETAMEEKDVETRMYAKSADIEVSLYGSAEKAGIPASVVAQAIHIFSWDIDFQRDIRRGDAVELLYEQVETVDGIKVKTGDIVYARLNINGQDIPIYRYETADGDVDYFTADGASVRKALMKTPIDGARLSSGFGMRRHPVLGYDKMHKGVDFAAPKGTPIYAAGDGTVEKAGKWNAYGNYIRIRHNSTTKTAYAHLNGFAKGVSAGTRVKQGQVIGYVGTTGRSTGPHLHYEVLLNGAQVNPNSVKLPQGEILTGKQLAAFRDHMQKINRQYALLSGSTKLASRQSGDYTSGRY